MATGEHGHAHGTRAIVAAAIANLGIALAKLLGFAFTRSSSMLAESIHSFADTGNQVLLLFGGRRARRPATTEHPFGYGRERYFWAFVVALVLFSVGGLFALYEGIEKVRHPHELESPGWAFGILGVAIVLECFSLRTAVQESRPLKGRGSWADFIRHSRNPELPVVLLEDLGALFGLVLALGGVTLTVLTDEPRFDALGSICIGVLLIAIAVVLMIQMKGLLIGESATAADQAAIRGGIEAGPEAARLIHMRTQHIGPDELLVGAKIALPSTLTGAEIAAAIDAAEDRVRAAVPSARVIYLEPDLLRGEAPTADGGTP